MDTETMSEIMAVVRRSAEGDTTAIAQFYGGWAEDYEKHMCLLSYRSHLAAVEFLTEHFSGPREEAVVLDVGCGTGLVAKQMNEVGFKHFTGVDGSHGMLDKAEESGLYRCLKQAILGPDSLPVENDTFDVVISAGALGVGFVPVSVVGELCQAAKPGGLVCISMGNHTCKGAKEFKANLEQKLQLMEQEGLWREVGIKQIESYMINVRTLTDTEDLSFVPGTVYLYKKS